MVRGAKTLAGTFAVVAALYVKVAGAEPASPVPSASPSAGPPSTPDPAPSAPPVPAVPPAAPAAAPIAPATVAPAPALSNGGEAWVHFSSNYDGAWLEGRNRIDDERWKGLCPAPCDRPLVVEGLDLRVRAPRMTTSNTFTIEPGAGIARLRISGGSASARTLGIVGLAAGLPITFAGVTLLGVGSIHSDSAERTAGIVTLCAGAAAVLAALPLLVMGSTSVTNAEGRHVAKNAGAAPAF